MKVLLVGELSGFCEQLEMVIRAGIPIQEGIGMMREGIEDEALGEWLGAIERELERGEMFVQALQHVGGVPEDMVSLLTVGFETGKLEEVLALLGRYYQKEEETQKNIKRIVFYPIILLGIISLVVGVLSTQVMPIFQDILENLGVQMSGIAMGVMQMGIGLARVATVLLGGIVVMGVAVYLNKGRNKWVNWVYQKGYQSKLYKKIALQRVTTVMSLTLASGMDNIYALEMAKDLVMHDLIRKELEICLQKVMQGKSLVEGLKESGIFSNLAISMLSMGNRTGCLAEMMAKLADAYEEEVDSYIERILMRIEPVVIMLLAGVIGSILLAVMLPLMSIMSIMA